jgi:hypothetical protein
MHAITSRSSSHDNESIAHFCFSDPCERARVRDARRACGIGLQMPRRRWRDRVSGSRVRRRFCRIRNRDRTAAAGHAVARLRAHDTRSRHARCTSRGAHSRSFARDDARAARKRFLRMSRRERRALLSSRDLPGKITAEAASGKHGRSASTAFAVTSEAMPRSEACRRIAAAGSIGRAGHERDQSVSTYDRNLGRDPCRYY